MDRFWSKVQKTDGCWFWTGGVRRKNEGYGAFWFNRKQVPAHRFAFELAGGSIRAGDEIAHKCDTPRCVRPDHLFATSHAGNMADKVMKGRQARAEKNGNGKLSDADAERIKEASLFGASSRDLASVYGVTRTTIWKIKTGQRALSCR